MHVTLVSPPPDRTSGVGQYADHLSASLDDRVTLDRVFLETDSADPVHFVRQALRAARGDADVVHVQYDYVVFGPLGLYTFLFFATLGLASAGRDVAVVVTVHEVLNRDLVAPPLARLKAAYARTVNRTLSRSADRLVFLSPQARERFRASVATGRSVCLPHGSQRDLPDDAITDRATARAAFGYGEDDVVVVEPGYVSRRKGSDVVVSLARRCPDYEFLLAGGPARDRLAAFVDDLERRAPANVTITGRLPTSRFHAAFAAADLVVLPYNEVAQTGVVNAVNQSGVFNWCASHEVPVAATDCERFRSLNERWGCPALFDVADPADVERRVVDIVTDEGTRRDLREAVAAYAAANDLSAVAADHVDLYREVTA